MLQDVTPFVFKKTMGGLSIVQVKEIFTSQVGPMDQLTDSRIMIHQQSVFLPV